MDFKKLYDRVLRMRHETLMEEPCPFYEPGWADVTENEQEWEKFWNEKIID